MAKLTVTDNCQAAAEATVEVTIVGPTPPANGTVTPVPPGTAEPEPPSGEATLGFCHLVQYGQTLSGIAAFYGVPLPVLAEVNGVSTSYFVIAGQGLFIPVSQVGPGPNIYEAQPGDTLNLIAYQCGLPTGVLAAANNLDPGATLTPGQPLIIPLWRQVYP
jgi:LysM repeat protein